MLVKILIFWFTKPKKSLKEEYLLSIKYIIVSFTLISTFLSEIYHPNICIYLSDIKKSKMQESEDQENEKIKDRKKTEY